MKYALQCHPVTPCSVVQSIGIELRVEAAQRLTVCYSLFGEMTAIRIPPPGEPCQADELWQHTCCELFVGSVKNEIYYEFNFSPSTAWSAYSFEAYRRGMQFATVTPPRIQVTHDDERLSLQASVELGELGIDDARLAISAVVEETNGRKSYWALKHPAERPDFHHTDGFIVKL